MMSPREEKTNYEDLSAAQTRVPLNTSSSLNLLQLLSRRRYEICSCTDGASVENYRQHGRMLRGNVS